MTSQLRYSPSELGNVITYYCPGNDDNELVIIDGNVIRTYITIFYDFDLVVGHTNGVENIHRCYSNWFSLLDQYAYVWKFK